jgi:Uma2 family endonuclease
LEDQIEIPSTISSLDEFRRWVHSKEFPERGRIDFIRNRIEIDMSAEELITHGTPKGEIYATLHQRAKRMKLGRTFVDKARVTNMAAELSAEPDIVFVSWESFESGRIQLVPKSAGGEGRYVELEGSPDLIVEIVSDSSATKDMRRLPVACFDAGVRKYWLVDARRAKSLVFRIHQRGKKNFRSVKPDEDGFQFSNVFNAWFRLDRSAGRDGHWVFDLRSKEA